MVDGESVAYSLCSIYDPLISERLGLDVDHHRFAHVFRISTQNKSLKAEEFVESVKSSYKIPGNLIFALK